MKIQHTLGPWSYTSEDNGDEFKLLAGKEIVVGGCGCCGSPWISSDADAKLIAAAPDLLAALQKIAEEDRHDVRTLSDQGPVYIHGPCGTIALEAIAKATGETHE